MCVIDEVAAYKGGPKIKRSDLTPEMRSSILANRPTITKPGAPAGLAIKRRIF